MENKLAQLESVLADLRSVVIAYSGGVDSTLLIAVAARVLDKRALAVTASSPIHPDAELRLAQAVASDIGVRHMVIETNELDDPLFVANDEQRCYYCKRGLFAELRRLAGENGLSAVADGTNYEDLREPRPGLRAAWEYAVVSPLAEVTLTKSEIRHISRGIGLSNWDKPSSPCLATRLPHGTPISEELLSRVARAEECLASFGLTRLRVRHHGDIARIEVQREDMALLADEGLRKGIVDSLRAIGYTYVTLDLADRAGERGMD